MFLKLRKAGVEPCISGGHVTLDPRDREFLLFFFFWHNSRLSSIGNKILSILSTRFDDHDHCRIFHVAARRWLIHPDRSVQHPRWDISTNQRSPLPRLFPALWTNSPSIKENVSNRPASDHLPATLGSRAALSPRHDQHRGVKPRSNMAGRDGLGCSARHLQSARRCLAHNYRRCQSQRIHGFTPVWVQDPRPSGSKTHTFSRLSARMKTDTPSMQ